MDIYAFGHKKRVGKDTAAGMLLKIIAERFPHTYIQKVSFARKMKEMCFQLYRWDGLMHPDQYECVHNAELRDVPLPTIGKTPRQIWIEFGTTVGRSIYENTWVDLLIRGPVGGLPKASIMIISDLRFPNEAARIREFGGKLIKIENPRVPVTDDVADVALDGFDGWDYVIQNDGTIRNLREKIGAIWL